MTTLAHQHIAHKLNRSDAANIETVLINEMERAITPLFLAIMFVLAGLVFGAPLYFVGHAAAMKECPPAQHGERLISSEQRKDGTVCNYSTGWNLYGRNKVSRNAK